MAQNSTPKGAALATARPAHDDRYYSPSKWTQRHDLVCILHASGLRNKEVAAATGFSEPYVSVILNDARAEDAVRDYASRVADSMTDVRLKLKAYAHEALDEVVDEMRNCTDPRVRQRAAFGIMDRAGYSKVQKHLVAQTEIGPKEIHQLESALEESASENDAYEVDYEIVED